jgi:hypothetical protein
MLPSRASRSSRNGGNWGRRGNISGHLALSRECRAHGIGTGLLKRTQSYVDRIESGQQIPVAVVVGIIVHESQLWQATAALALLRTKVPAKWRENFTFHATEIWNSQEYRPEWSMEDRHALLAEALSIPCRLGLSIGFAAVIKSRGSAVENAPRGLAGMTKQSHIVCFMDCIEAIDGFIPQYAWPGEFMTVVAENVPEMRRYLRFFVEELKTGQVPRVGHSIDLRGDEPIISPLSGVSQITRLVDVIRFAAKHEAPLLQLADVCAFALRRFWAGLAHGDKLVAAMLGPDGIQNTPLAALRNFTTPGISGVLPFIPPHLVRPDKRAEARLGSRAGVHLLSVSFPYRSIDPWKSSLSG